MGPRLASCVASRTTEIQGHRQGCRARRGGPRTPSTTTEANLDCAFVENALFTNDRSLILKSQQNRIELVTRPGALQSLQHLHLDGNNITKLAKDAFGNLRVVSLLTLSNNRLFNVSYGAFEKLLQIQTLDLRCHHQFLFFLALSIVT